jgi:hypothetical protein
MERVQKRKTRRKRGEKPLKCISSLQNKQKAGRLRNSVTIQFTSVMRCDEAVGGCVQHREGGDNINEGCLACVVRHTTRLMRLKNLNV